MPLCASMISKRNAKLCSSGRKEYKKYLQCVFFSALHVFMCLFSIAWTNVFLGISLRNPRQDRAEFGLGGQKKEN